MNWMSNKYFKVVQKTTTVILTISNIFSKGENSDLIFRKCKFSSVLLRKKNYYTRHLPEAGNNRNTAFFNNFETYV